MNSFFDTVVEILKQDDRFFTAEGELLRNAVYEAAMKMDPKLIKMLFENADTKARFFTDVDGISVFDKVGFGWVINNREFLPDSYTRYKNKIGLINKNDMFISQSNDVVLAFPYKDCILEFDTTKEKQDRAEVFYNEVLAKDDVDRLFAKKVFSNAKRVSSTGTSDITRFDSSDNLIIKGNNLIALHVLDTRFHGKVKLMYWDILFNTSNDVVPYNDSFKHTSWLTMMKNRIEAALPLLDKDGFLVIECDKNEDAYLTVLMDELIGRDNHICTISVKSNSISGNKTQHKDKTILKNKDSILVYSMSTSPSIAAQYTEKTEWDTHYNLYIDKTIADNWSIVSLKDILIREGIINHNETLSKDLLSNKTFYAFILKHKSNIARYVNSIPPELEKYSIQHPNKIVSLPDNENSNYYAYNGKRLSFLENAIKIIRGKERFAQLLGDLWTDIDFQNTQNEGNVSLPAGKKPEALLERIIRMFTNENDLVLDAYLGSGTTGAVALKTGRRFIGIEQLSDHYEKSIQRLSFVISGDKSGISKSVNWNGGGSFVCCELAKLNEAYVDRIQEATDNDTLCIIWNEMKKTGFISAKIDPKDINPESEDFKTLSLENKKRLLMELLDLNQLYINYCDIDDESFNVLATNKAFTKSFYGEE